MEDHLICYHGVDDNVVKNAKVSSSHYFFYLMLFTIKRSIEKMTTGITLAMNHWRLITLSGFLAISERMYVAIIRL